MNKKYLLGMLAGGALLAACTTDDFDSAKVAQQVNPSSPVFTVTFDNGDLQTRASYTGYGKLNKVVFEDGDEMSLFHGIPTKDFAIFYNLSGWQNAIYKANEDTEAEEAETGGLTFSTQAMIQKGYAVMVYPAYKGFDQMGDNNTGAAAPKVTISAEQKMDYSATNTPYISELIQLGDKEEGTEQAGYGENYEIRMKRVAGTLTVLLDEENIPNFSELDEEIEDIEIQSVTIDLSRSELGNTKGFSLALPVKVTGAVSQKVSKENKAWKYATTLNRDYDNSSSEMSYSLTTEDIHQVKSTTFDGKAAYFTILPNNDKAGVMKGGDVIIQTNYGTITIENGEKAFGSKHDTDFAGAMTVAIPELWKEAGEADLFEGEEVGGVSTWHVLVDGSKLDLNGVHIKTDSNLKTILKVYDLLNKDDVKNAKPVILTLDGDQEDNKTFEMSATTAELLEQMLTKYEGKLSFAICDKAGEACSVIRLVNTDKEADATLPNIAKFTRPEGDHSGEPIAWAYNVELVGNWTVADGKDEPAKLWKVQKLTVLEDGVLNLSNMTLNIAATLNSGEIAIANYGNINVAGRVYLANNVTNFGKITIDENASLIVTGTHKLINREGENKVDETSVKDWNEGAEIENHGELMLDKQNGNNTIENYGRIDVYASSTLLITKNQDTSASVTGQFSSSNRMGTIYLNAATACAGKMQIDDAYSSGSVVKTKAGFVKYPSTITPTCSYANYVIVDTQASTMPANNTTYVELNAGTYDVTSNLTYTGLIIADGVKITITDGKTLKADYFYHNGYITEIGTLNVTSTAKTGYYNLKEGTGEIYSYNN